MCQEVLIAPVLCGTSLLYLKKWPFGAPDTRGSSEEKLSVFKMLFLLQSFTLLGRAVQSLQLSFPTFASLSLAEKMKGGKERKKEKEQDGNAKLKGLQFLGRNKQRKEKCSDGDTDKVPRVAFHFLTNSGFLCFLLFSWFGLVWAGLGFFFFVAWVVWANKAFSTLIKSPLSQRDSDPGKEQSVDSHGKRGCAPGVS